MSASQRHARLEFLPLITLGLLFAAGLVAYVLTAPAEAQNTCTVTDASDSGDDTLRERIGDATCKSIDFAITGDILLKDPLNIERDVVIAGPGSKQLTVVAGEGVRVFWIAPEVTVEISGLSITGGQAQEGGGIYNDGGNLTLIGSTVSGNTANVDGGGIYNEGMLTVTGSTISGNSTLDEGSNGGGISNAGELAVTGSTISGNSSFFGGGIYNWFGFDAVATVDGSIISENHGENGGGGIFNESGGTVTVTGSTISGNDESGIYNIGAMTLVRSTVSGNSSIGPGGGIFNVFGQVTLTESTVSGNTAGGDGGGINNADGGVITVENSTISGNSAEFGSAVNQEDGELTMKNSVVAANTFADGNCSLAGGTFNAQGNNLADDDSCTGFAQVANVMLGPLGNNGGPTLTRALLAGSPAIDAVSDCTFVDGTTPVATDQRGAPRPHGPACDVGAFEFGAAPLPTLGPGQRFWGDADCDKNVAIGDALKTARHLLGLSVSQEPGCPEIGSDVTADGVSRVWGDIDCDDSLAIGDALKLGRHLLGLSVSQAAGCPELGATVTLK